MPVSSARTGHVHYKRRRSDQQTCAITFIQRFGSAANLNIHLHCLILDGVYRMQNGVPEFHGVRTPTAEQLQALHSQIIKLNVHASLCCRITTPPVASTLNSEQTVHQLVQLSGKLYFPHFGCEISHIAVIRFLVNLAVYRHRTEKITR